MLKASRSEKLNGKRVVVDAAVVVACFFYDGFCVILYIPLSAHGGFVGGMIVVLVVGDAM